MAWSVRFLVFSVAAISLLALAGSVIAPSPERADGAHFMLGGDACGARALQHLVGEEFATVREADYFEDAQVRNHVSALTLEFEPERLNVLLSGDGRIAAIGCF